KTGRIHAPEGVLEIERGLRPADKARAILKIRFPAYCWRVAVESSRTNAREQAIWLANIATSLMRLSYPAGHHPLPYGAREPSPGLPADTLAPSVTVVGKDALPLAGYSTAQYLINSELVEAFGKSGLSAKMRDLVQADTNLVGRGLAQGLGWLTRGRQAHSQPERLLFFFTAVEALLFTDDRNTPVTQTITRHAATLLSDDVAKRAVIAKELADLYNVRSQLVHGGEREVSNSHANRIQELAEALYRT